MQVNKHIFFVTLACITSLFGMEEYNPHEVIRITSFFYSLMAGSCIASDAIIEFSNYQDTALRHQITFTNAQKLVERYQKTSKLLDNPLEELFKQEHFANLPKKTLISLLKQDLTLQEAKEIQIYFFYKLMEKSKIRSVQDSYLKGFLNGIHAIYYGAQERFNSAMHLIKKTGRPIPNPTQRVEEYGDITSYQCFQ